jgi:hypothetical protein|tara:strand:- start:4071 stop:4856 length:786 start_codon:yes stop_codon:yes gene_type:complete
MAKQLAEKKQQQVATIDPSMLLEDANTASDSMSSDDLLIPRIRILQALSPQVIKQKSEYVEGAEAGMIFDNSSNSLFDGEKGINVVPVNYRRCYIEWDKKRNFVKDHGTDASILEQCVVDGYQRFHGDNEIVATAEYFVFIVQDDQHFPAMVSMQSSNWKVAKRWNSIINRLMIPNPNGGKMNPAMFWNMYNLFVVPQTNEQGAWFGWEVKPVYTADSGGIIDNLENGTDIYLSARTFKEQVISGDVQVQQDESSADEEQF